MLDAKNVVRRYYDPDTQISTHQMEVILGVLRFRADGCNLLVFGLGRDSIVWEQANADGYTLFVESQDAWIDFAKVISPQINVCKVSYEGRTVSSSVPICVDDLERYPVPEDLLARTWDVIIIDSPYGFGPECPGRSLPIYWTSRLAKSHTHVFVDDYERDLEKAYANAFIAKLSSYSVVMKRPGKEMYWSVGSSPSFHGFEGIGHDNAVVRLKHFLNTTQLRVYLFHDSIDIIPSLVGKGIGTPDTHVFFSFSWVRDEAALRYLRHLLLSGPVGEQSWCRANCHFLLNSEMELREFCRILPEFDGIHFNNASLLNPNLFFVSSEDARLFDAVMNAKPLVFKRHYLSGEIDSKLFITYDVKSSDSEYDTYVDIDRFRPSSVVKNILEADVANYLSTANVGLMLSSVEGACYASAEYLLCGLPVVSTHSIGGRDDFYDETNSVIVKDAAEEVMCAVSLLVSRLNGGDIDRQSIRNGYLAKRRVFLRRLSDKLGQIFVKHGVDINSEKFLFQAISAGNKLKNHRNFWIKSIV